MQSRNQSLFALLLLSAVACAVQNAGAGIDDPTGGDDEGGSAAGGTSAQAGKGTLPSSGSTSTPIAGTTSKGGSGGKAGGSGGKGGASSGGKGGKGGSSSGGTEAAGGSDDGPVNMPIVGLSVTFKADSAADPVDFLGGELDVINDTAQPLTFADMKVRYYFTNEVTAAMPAATPMVMMNWAQFGKTNNLGGATCSGQIVKLPKATAAADSYVELTCSASAATDLTAGTLLKISWKAGAQGQGKFIQAGDYSFTDPTKIVVVNGNTIVWGVEPS
jgi:hypothetical protein